MNNAGQQYLNDLDKRLWSAADRLRANVNPGDYMHVVLGLVTFPTPSRNVETSLKRPSTTRPTTITSATKPATSMPKRSSRNSKPATTTLKRTFSGCRRWPVGISSRTTPRSPPAPSSTSRMARPGNTNSRASAACSTTPSMPSKRKTPGSRTSSTRITPASAWTKLPGLIDLLSTVPFQHESLKAKDILGHVYEYFLGEFSIAAGKRGGEFYTPKSIVSLIVEMLEPYQGRVYDPCCGSGGFFVQSERFVEEHGGRIGQLSVYGQEANPTTWRLASMNMAIRGMDFDFGKEPASTYTRPQHPDLRADFIMVNPPFNMKDWNEGVKDEDVRWKYGVPPTGNANFAWMQHT